MGLTFKLGTAPQVTTNYIPKSNSNSFSNSLLYDNGTSVAIGTTAPDAGAPFTIDKTGAGLQTLAYFQNQQAAAADTGTSIYFLGTSGLNSLGRFVSAWEGSSISSSYMAFWTRGGGTTSEKLRISSGGNVGINNSNPAYYLDVSGNAKFGSNSINGDTIIQSNSTPLQIRGRSTYDRPFLHISWDVSPDSGVLIADTLRFNTGATLGTNSGTERMRITSGGQVWIDRSSNPAGSIMALSNSGVTIYGTTGQYRQLNQSGAVLGFFNGSNEATLTSAGVWTNASDISIKKDIKEIEYGLNEVMQLKPKSYKMIEDDLEQIGFIAQDVEEVLPELVSTSEKGMKGLSYGNLTAVLVKAIQEQNQLILELSAKVSALENKA